ncbi:MAG: hypothetical protein Q8R00_02355 [Candidatus Nanoarchaeia archaeon]|nr:hypothetical protein [Candidatus Nanoarchaeia archaeon]
MYKKYVKKGDKKLGPYYYESVREKNGKIKTVYLGKNPAKLKHLNIETTSSLSNGKTIITPVFVESNVVKDALALNEIFIFSRIPEPLMEIPTPGKKDFDFENLLFILVSLFYISGFFYLEGSITGLAVSEVSSATNLFPWLVGIIYLGLILFIYIDFRRRK